MNDLVEIVREETFLQGIRMLGHGYGGAVVWKRSPHMVCIELVEAVHGEPVISRWREQAERGAQEWPIEFDTVQVFWVGRVRPDPGLSDPGWWLRLGPLADRQMALEVMRCSVWHRGAPVWAELESGGPPKLTILEPARVRADDLFQAWRALELVALVQANAGRAGRSRGHLVGVTPAEFTHRYEQLRSLLGAQPTQARLAQEFFVDESTIRRFRGEHGIRWPPV